MNFGMYTQSKKRGWLGWGLIILTLLISSVSGMLPSDHVVATTLQQQRSPSSYLPMVRNRVCSGTRSPENTMGTQLYGATGRSFDNFTQLQEARPVWIRNTIHWDEVEPENVPTSDFNWHQADRAVRVAVDLCANMLITIDHTPDWATIMNYRSPMQTQYLDDFREFIVAVVERYDGDGFQDAPNGAVVNYWELYNEPDFGSTVPEEEGWGEYGARYAEMLKTVYPAIKEANRNAKVVMGGLAYNLFIEDGGLFERDFFQTVLDEGGGEYFDVMNFHYYPFNRNRVMWTQTNGSGLREKYADIQKQMVEAGIGEKPFLISEIGWHSATRNDHLFPSTPEYQSRRVTELLTQAKAMGSIATIWWAFEDNSLQFHYETGLINSNTPPETKPSHKAFQEVVRRVGDGIYEATVVLPSANNDLEAYRFRDTRTNKPFYVAWLTPTAPYDATFVPSFNDDATQPLEVEGAAADVYDKYGTRLHSVRDGDDGKNDGKLTVSVGRSPIYIVTR